jgi:sugar O-acyltransferase (sialic acid O-acetyltransferase NeuD family)
MDHVNPPTDQAPSPLLLVAASGLAREVCALAEAQGQVVLGCLDDNPERHGTELTSGVPILGGLDRLADHLDAEVLICVGKGTTRSLLLDRILSSGPAPVRFATMVHPTVVVPSTCSVGEGSILLAGTVLTADVTVGRHVVCMPHVVLTHDDVVEDFATLCAGVVLGGTVTVGRAAYLGMAASVRENLTIGAEATLAMGAVVVRDVPPGTVYAGVPARAIGTGPA